MSEKKEAASQGEETKTFVDTVAQNMGKLGLQVNGSVAAAQAIADAFNILQPQFEQMKSKLMSLARENDALHAETNRLRQAVELTRKKKDQPSV